MLGSAGTGYLKEVRSKVLQNDIQELVSVTELLIF